MKIFAKELSFSTQGYSHTINITDDIRSLVQESQLSEGIVNLFVIGSTASISTIEYEPNLKIDMKEALEKIAPSDREYHHHKTWGDHNGFSHVRATLMGPGITVPLHQGELVLGTWQQIVILDHDDSPRQRRIFVQIMGL